MRSSVANFIRRLLSLAAGLAGLSQVNVAHAYVVQQNAGFWASGNVVMQLQLAGATGTLIDGSTSWNQVAVSALTDWNQVLGRIKFTYVNDSTAANASGNSINNVSWNTTVYGDAWGSSTIGICIYRWFTQGGVPTVRSEADVVFNSSANRKWNSYRGNLVRATDGTTLFDLKRVALHEFGHALGLSHPDESGQSVNSIMNSATNNTDALTPDDIAGVSTIYGVVGGGRISNLSVRTSLASGQNLVVGFVTSGAKNMLVRAVGPSLKTVFNVTDFYADPKFTINNSGGTVIDQNDNWASNLSATFVSVGAFGLDVGSKDAALVRSISGPNTAQVNGTGSGLMLVEVYDTDSATAAARLTNVSARNQVGTGANILVSGFVITGTGTCKLLIRGIGPALNDIFGVNGVLVDPKLEIHQTVNGVDTVLASNDDWDASLAATFSSVGAYAFKAGSKDAAIFISLPPGVYTAQVSGANSGTGDGVVEIYEVP